MSDPGRLQRLRDILREGARPSAASNARGAQAALCSSRVAVAESLGGVVEAGPTGPCTVVRRTYDGDHRYGRRRLGTYPALSCGALDFLAGHPVGRTPAGTDATGDACASHSVVCFDLETTGLSGGAGTVAFLVGLGWFEGDSFQTCQYFLSHLGDESRMLGAVARVLAKADTVVTFNGRSFDGPVTESRFAFHRQPSPLAALRHVDLLHPGRRLWRKDECRLVRLERDVLGLHRVDDVPSAEIPARYVSFLRGGGTGGLAPVFEHNRLDLVSLGALTGLACDLVRRGVEATSGVSQAYGLGRLSEQAGWTDRAVECYRAAGGLDRAIDRTGSTRSLRTTDECDARANAFARLAAICRRRREYAAAAELWTRLLAVPGGPERLRREARVALAVHHEHRVRDLAAAERFAQAALYAEAHPGRRRAVQHRLTRLERKREQAGAMLQEDV